MVPILAFIHSAIPRAIREASVAMAGGDAEARLVRVELGPQSYEIRIVTDRLGELGPFARACVDRSWSAGACRTGNR